jgi:hypothetical protein
MMNLVEKLRVLGGAAGGPNVHDDAADRINELETAAAHPLSNPNLIARVARLENALRAAIEYVELDSETPYPMLATWKRALGSTDSGEVK